MSVEDVDDSAVYASFSNANVTAIRSDGEGSDPLGILRRSAFLNRRSSMNTMNEALLTRLCVVNNRVVTARIHHVVLIQVLQMILHIGLARHGRSEVSQFILCVPWGMRCTRGISNLETENVLVHEDVVSIGTLWCCHFSLTKRKVNFWQISYGGSKLETCK